MKITTIIAVCLLLGACNNKEHEQKSVRSIKVDTVKVYGMAGSTSFPGKVIAASDIKLAFRVSGPIAKVNYEVGAFIRKGEIIAQIDPRDYEIQLAATEAEYNRIKSEVDRITELYEKGSVTPNDYDKARFGYQQISAKLEAHKNALKDTKLLAPTDGYIQKRLFEQGETVGAGIPVISMIEAGQGEVELNIPSSDYIRRDQFEEYYCTSDIFPNTSFPLEFISITPKANINQLYTMQLRMKGDTETAPSPGMSVMVTIKFKNKANNTVSIPFSSVFQSEGKSNVWVYNADKGTVNKRTITVSEILTDGKAVISSGLQEGDLVVTAGIHSIKEGQKVRVIPPVSSTNVGGLI